MSSKKITVSLIHNNDEKRLSLIRPSIENFVKKTTQNNFLIEYFESFYQPENKKYNFWGGVKRDIMYWVLIRRWSKYRDKKPRFLVFDIFILAYRLFFKYLVRKERREKWLSSCFVEIFLANKHIESIFKAFKNNSDYLIVFEDDAVFRDNSIANILNFINNDKINEPIYLDLAGGCSLDELDIDNLELYRDDCFRYFKKPITNTTCSYLINKNQIKIFIDIIIKFPEVRKFSPDWMFNKIFILQDKYNIKSVCLHSDPPFLNHGSVTGEFNSLIR